MRWTSYVYRAAAQHVLDHKPVYDDPVLGLFMYTYSLFSTLVFLPFALMSHQTAVVVWSALTLLCLLASVLLCLRSLGHRIDWPIVLIAVSITAASTMLEPVRTTLWYGQVNVFLMTVILWDLLRQKKSYRFQGFWTGMTAGIKITPGLFAVYEAICGRWRAALMIVAGAAFTVAIGFIAMPRASWKFWGQTLWDSRRVGPTRTPGNQSIHGALATSLGTDSPSEILWLLLAGIGLLLGCVAAWISHRKGEEVLALSLIGCASAAVSPFSWGHHWVWLVPLLVYLVHRALETNARRAWKPLAMWSVLIAALYTSAFLWKGYTGHPITVGTAHFPFFYGMGLFMVPVPGYWRWFAAQPYLWVFGIAAVTTIVAWGPSVWRDRSVALTPSEADLGIVGGRR